MFVLRNNDAHHYSAREPYINRLRNIKGRCHYWKQSKWIEEDRGKCTSAGFSISSITLLLSKDTRLTLIAKFHDKTSGMWWQYCNYKAHFTHDTASIACAYVCKLGRKTPWKTTNWIAEVDSAWGIASCGWGHKHLLWTQKSLVYTQAREHCGFQLRDCTRNSFAHISTSSAWNSCANKQGGGIHTRR